MVATPRGIATCSLSCRADPSRLGAHQFKTKAGTPFPPLSFSFLSFLLLLPPLSSLLSGGFSSSLRCSWWEVTPRETSQQWQGARRMEETGR
ncbi:hypothetical protein Taro_051814 [Colocasia esculenta]|uniref:Uncharacterized protein n=1 Tax=Colocasia esculenta TaxID=4460 RepID=A0A843XIE6_COLES|nr:hypothetical protein [Colocasia esculenta]